ncbi:MAG: choice-of-anchor B family protein [Aureispira sp.]|nr:choice-of-anchor B family protein [Aureispira sp.]
MKILVLITLMLLWGSFAYTQQTPANSNLTLVGQLNYAQGANDIWGYVDSTGVEYALVGTRTGTSIVSLANPANPVEVLFIPGATSTWRDLKVWGDHAFVTTDQGSGTDGLVVIDLSPLPTNTPTYYSWKPILPSGLGTSPFHTAHNLYIDEKGYCYIAGSNINNGEPFILDVHTNPDTPIYTGAVLPIYAHDVYARGDTLWTSDIYTGKFSVYDVSNRNAPIFLADHPTPSTFTHNAWLSDDGNSLFTTDEKANAWIGSYDVSDLGNIQELDRWKTPTPNTIPHNVHVLNNYLVISYYTDGLIILDASHPDNLVEVGRYDTYNGLGITRFEGAWGAYPFLPSGLILVSDRQTGLYVLQPNYERACRLEGVVTEQGTGNLLFGVEVTLDSVGLKDNTDLFGNYKIGIGKAGTYNATFRKIGYVPKTIQVNLINGQISIANIDLEPAVPFTFTGRVVEQMNPSVGISSAKIRLKSEWYEFNGVTDANGYFNIAVLADNNYELIAGKWGYQSKQELALDLLDSTNLPIVEIALEKGYRDEFALDLGWTVSGSATSGIWERVEPQQIFHQNYPLLPSGGDVAFDIGKSHYVTGNNGTVIGVDDVDGETILTSPIFDLTTYIAPKLSCYYYVCQFYGPDSMAQLELSISNGSTTVVLDQDAFRCSWGPQKKFMIKDYITPTATMQVTYTIQDIVDSTVIEGGLDYFEIVDTASVISSIVDPEKIEITIFPNPSTHSFQVEYNLNSRTPKERYKLSIHNILGQKIEDVIINNTKGYLELGESWEAGVYFVSLEGQLLKLLKH